jgi:SAM-dependent methyltransferase
MTEPAPIANTAQFDYWNDQAGRTWAALQQQLDQQIAPLGLAAMRALGPQPGQRVLDIGCGCGDTTLALARRVAPGGSVLGLDISAPMLAVARERAAGEPGIEFLQADAQTARFETKFNAAFSRFGVMFFADPASAFATIATALHAGSKLAFVCWRAAAENVWMSAPFLAAQPLLPALPADDPDAPGPFAFANPDRVRSILYDAGYANITISPHDEAIGGFDLETAVHLALRVGPLGRLLREAPEQTDNVQAVVRDTLQRYDSADGIWMKSATWIVQAEAK